MLELLMYLFCAVLLFLGIPIAAVTFGSAGMWYYGQIQVIAEKVRARRQ